MVALVEADAARPAAAARCALQLIQVVAGVVAATVPPIPQSHWSSYGSPAFFFFVEKDKANLLRRGEQLLDNMKFHYEDEELRILIPRSPVDPYKTWCFSIGTDDLCAQ